MDNVYSTIIAQAFLELAIQRMLDIDMLKYEMVCSQGSRASCSYECKLKQIK